MDDEDYFLCLPSNTKFVALAKNEKWSTRSLGTPWMRERGRGGVFGIHLVKLGSLRWIGNDP